MKQILLFGAGKSATVLIDYLLTNAAKENWKLIVADTNLQLATDKIKNSPSGTAASFDIMNAEKRESYISKADIVISMLPPALHSKVAKDCLHFSKHLLTASYVDDDIRSMQAEIENKKLLFLCEMGLDPGIDHMSAMKLVDEIHGKGGKITSFRSHCGGLVAPESDDNPWHYKISWNPRNIVMAGKAGAVFKKNNEIFNVPYEAVFENNETVIIPELGELAFYPNRDSLSYIPVYGLEETSTFTRTTLRHADFCKAWNCIVKANLTDEDKSAAAVAAKHISYREWVDKSISLHTSAKNFEGFLDQYVQEPDKLMVKNMFAYLGLLSNEGIPLTAGCSADILQFVFESKLSLLPHDKDMIVMLHEFEYTIKGQPAAISSSLIVKGENGLHTAMAKTVGLPLGIAAKRILDGTITTTGLHIPILKEIYEPVLKELEQYSITFNEASI
ncbi:MAG: saccharopine dehydrogenase C-terminal domain-containing protein [Chitinophagaceae bacterium]